MDTVKVAVRAEQLELVSARRWRRRRIIPLYVMLVPASVLLVLFRYLPMFGLIIAFQDYKPLLGFRKSAWVGFQQFQTMLATPDFWEIVRNTLVIAVGKIVAGQLAGVIFALLLNELAHMWYRRVIQSMSYLPHFISWVVFGGILLDMLSYSGLLNDVIAVLGLERIWLLGHAATFPLVMVFTHTWKGFGWGAVIYLAALTGIDPVLYEVAAVDGAGRWQRMLHVTLPGMGPTIALMATLALGRALNAGFTQILVMYNPTVYSTGDVISTWIYRVGLVGMQFSLGVAVGLVRGCVGLALIALSYYLADRLANYRIF